MVPIGCPETSLGNYRYSLRANPENRNSLIPTCVFSVSSYSGDSRFEMRLLLLQYLSRCSQNGNSIIMNSGRSWIKQPQPLIINATTSSYAVSRAAC